MKQWRVETMNINYNIKRDNNIMYYSLSEFERWLHTVHPILVEALVGCLNDQRENVLKRFIRKQKLKKINE